MKTCVKCELPKPIDEFGRHTRKPDGLRANCKMCERKPARPATCKNCASGFMHRGQGNLPKLCPDCEGTFWWCGKCESVLPHGDFHRQSNTRTGRSNKCKVCTLAYIRLDEVRAGRRANALMRNYGITPEQFDDMLIAQCGRCACCRRQLNEHLVVDHDHTSGIVRGLLCYGCNTGLGKLEDRAEGAHRAESYLWSSRDILAEFSAGQHSAEQLIGAELYA